MAAPNSTAAQFGFKTETTAGTVVTPDLFLPFTSESLMRTQDPVESAGIRAGRLYIDDEESSNGLIEVGGGVSGDLPVKGASTLIRAMLGAVSTSGSGPYTHEITPSDSLPSLTLQVGVPDGSGTVQPKTVAGAKCDSWEIAGEQGSLLTWAMEFIGQRLTLGTRTKTDVSTTNTSTTISSSSGFTEADLGKDVSGTGIPTGAYITAVPTSTTATISSAATATGSNVNVVVGKTLATASYPSSLSYFLMHKTTLSVGGSSVGLKGFTVGNSNSLERRFLGGRWSSEPTGTGDLRECTGTFNLEYSSNTQADRYYAGDFFTASVVATSLDGASTMTIAMNGRFTSDPTPAVGGRGRVMQDVAFKVGGSSDAAGITVTLVNGDSSAA